MSLFQEPGSELLIAAVVLGIISLLSKFVITWWQNEPIRRDEAFRSAPPMRED